MIDSMLYQHCLDPVRVFPALQNIDLSRMAGRIEVGAD